MMSVFDEKSPKIPAQKRINSEVLLYSANIPFCYMGQKSTGDSLYYWIQTFLTNDSLNNTPSTELYLMTRERIKLY
jgi:hypothetical protein